MEKKILIIHPYDKTTNFLERIKNHLQVIFPDFTHYYNIKPNDSSHNKCLNAIKDFSNNGLILFMGHGKSNCLYGAKGDFYGTLENELVKAEQPDKYYNNDFFISEKNLEVFSGKKIISLSCNSNGQIGRKAVELGAKVFLGFGDLPTSVDELKDGGQENHSGKSLATIEQALKTEINYIIKKSIEIGLLRNYSFSQLVDLIHFISSQKITHYLVSQKKINERKLIANYIYNFKREIKIYGNKHEKLAE